METLLGIIFLCLLPLLAGALTYSHAIRSAGPPNSPGRKGWVGWRAFWVFCLIPPTLYLPVLVYTVAQPKTSGFMGSNHDWAWVFFQMSLGAGLVAGTLAGLGGSLGALIPINDPDSYSDGRALASSLGSALVVGIACLTLAYLFFLE